MSRRIALVTGASSGFGRELARLFAADGHDVALVARSRDKLLELSEELEERYRVNAHICPRDLLEPGAADDIEGMIRDHDCTVHALVNSAGFATFGRFAAEDPKEISDLLQVNIASLTELTRRFLPGMIDRRAGRILNMASTAAFQPGPLMAVYCASKAYVLSLSLALAEELRGTGVTVTAFAPGPTRTGFQARAEMEDRGLVAGRALPDARDVAQVGYRAMNAGRPLAVEGTSNKLFAFGARLMPRQLAARIAQRALERTSAP